jgi:hypothetical protein
VNTEVTEKTKRGHREFTTKHELSVPSAVLSVLCEMFQAFELVSRASYKLKTYSSRRVRKRSATSTATDAATNAVIVARPTPAVPPFTRKPW